MNARDKGNSDGISVSKLPNGINLHFIKSDKFKTNTVCLLMRRPLERAAVTANALIPLVLERGCQKYPATAELNREKERLYGSIINVHSFKKGEEQVIECFMDIVNNRTAQDSNLLTQALELASEMMLRPLLSDGAFEPEYVKSEKATLRTYIESKINHKAEYAMVRLIEIMCEGEPFALYPLGYIEDLDGIDGKNLWDRYDNILRTTRIDFMFMGSVDEEALRNDIPELFKRDMSKLIEIKSCGQTRRKRGAKRVDEYADISQGKLCVGLGAAGRHAPDYYSLLLASEILGGESGSRLFNSVREKNSLCYYINSFVVRSKGIVIIQCGVDADKFDRTIELIDKEIDALKTGDIAEDELSKAKSGLTKRFAKIKDDPAKLLDFYISQHSMGLDYGLDEAIRHIGSVSLEDVHKTVKTLYTDTVYTYGRKP